MTKRQGSLSFKATPGQAHEPASTSSSAASRPVTASTPVDIDPEFLPKKGWTSYLNTTTLAVCIFFLYIFWCGRGMHRIMYPLAHLPPLKEGEATLDPLWPEGRAFDVLCYLSDSPEDPHLQAQHPLWQAKGLRYGWGKEERKEGEVEEGVKEVKLRLVTELQPAEEEEGNAEGKSGGAETKNKKKKEEEEKEVLIPDWFWRRVRRGKDVYLHVFVTRSPGLVNVTSARAREGGMEEGGEEGTLAPQVELQGHDGYSPLHGVVPLLKRQVYEAKPPKRRLLSGEEIRAPEMLKEGGHGLYWKPEVAVRLVTDFTLYPIKYLPPQIADHLDIVQVIDKARRVKSYRYRPPVHADEIGLTSDKYIPLNSSLASLPLAINYSPLSVARWQMMTVLESSMQTQKGWGLEETDIDDVRRLITDTNVYLLLLTAIASLLHLLFEFLAFQSDIAFWRKNKSLRGLSIRTLVMELVSQSIILLYLIDADSSLLITLPSAFGVLVQIWKVQKATGASLQRSKGGYWPTLVCTRLTTEGKIEGKEEKGKTDINKAEQEKNDSNAAAPGTQKETMDLDRVAIHHLTLVLAPLALGFAARSLLQEEYTGWYSWALSTLTSAVYTFGFILMTPQLYINYRLKSVSHLPWRFLCFRFVNTFIDDLFAFIIKMPTMHRISCFRDDVVFLIYLYQRWMYPVDKSRQIDAEDCAGSG
ncbi:Hypothetical protein NocV09_04400080 [Nannochloropsis oceanica]